MTEEDFTNRIIEMLKQRRSSVNDIIQVVANVQKTKYESTAATMAIPLLYAHWEGFVRECLNTYMTFIEAQKILPHTANPTIFAFSLRRQLRRLAGKQTVEQLTEFANATLELLSKPIQFSDKTIDTKSNLNFEVLEGLCSTLCINVDRLRNSKMNINALVNRRNSIAHGEKPQEINLNDVEKYTQLVLTLLNDFNTILQQSIINRTFCQSS